jgi:N-acyl homoserine lactone hydrolase
MTWRATANDPARSNNARRPSQSYVRFVLGPSLLVALAVVSCAAALLAGRGRVRGPRVILRRAGRRVLGACSVLLLVVGLLLSTFSAAPLPAPPPFCGPLPAASPPAGMAVYQLPTGVTHRSAAFAYRGGSFFDSRDFAMTAVLVRHPRGDVLIDTGFGREIDAQFARMPPLFRAVTSYTRGRPAADQLDAAGYDRKRLRALLLTHAHWDHASGVADFPGTPVWVTPEEHRFIRDGDWLTAVARTAKDADYVDYELDGGPYLGFPRSRDVYGDGSIVIVEAPGHTPGSVVVFLSLPTGARYALVGDLAWQQEGITEREERPWLQRTFGDSDPAAVRDGLLRLDAIALRWPSLVLVPAHDARGFAAMSTL